MIATLRLITLCALLVSASPLLSLTPNLPAGTLGPGMVVQTRTGPLDCIVDAPRPRLAPMRSQAHGVYAADIAVATGYVYSVRVLQSSGDAALDNAVLDALQKWRFRPRLIYKLIVPADFRGSTVHWGGR